MNAKTLHDDGIEQATMAPIAVEEETRTEPAVPAIDAVTTKENTTMTNAQVIDQNAPVSDDDLIFDFDSVTELPPIEGTFIAVISKAKRGRSQKGNPKFDLQWRIEEARDLQGNDITELLENRIIFDTLTLTSAAAWKVKQLLDATGEFNDGGRVQLSEDVLVGLRAMLVVNMETSPGVNTTTGKAYEPRPAVKVYKTVDSFAVGDVIDQALAS